MDSHQNEARKTETDTVEAAIKWLKADPYGGDVLDRVSRVTAFIHVEYEHNHVVKAIECTAEIIDLENAAQEESSPRYCYGVALQKLLNFDTVKMISDQPMSPQNRAAVGKVLARAGPPGINIVVARVRESHGFTEAVKYLEWLGAAGVGYGTLSPLLGEPKWYIVAAVAKTMGELGIEEAVPDLAKLMDHKDARIQQAALDALARMDNWSAATQLKQALTSKDRKRQSTAARAIGRQKRESRAFVSPLVGLTEAEKIDPEVLEDCYDALGSIGTNGALDALVEAARPGGRLMHRKPVEKRLAAIHGLSMMEADLAADELEELTHDRDKSVRAAAEEALEAVKKRGT